MSTPDLIIREDFRDLIPPLTPAELEQLHLSLDADGCARDPLIVWKGKNILLDGHNRYAYCKEHGYDFHVIQYSTLNEETARNFIIHNQLGRRNLAPDAMSRLRGLLYNSVKKGVGEHQGNQHTNGMRTECPNSTAQKLAESIGVTERTIRRDGKFAEATEKLGIGKDVMSGKEKRSRKQIIKEAHRDGKSLEEISDIMSPKVNRLEKLKSLWMKTSKKDRAAFIAWAKSLAA
jgi:hypothetical protein